MNYLIIGDDLYIRENETNKLKKKFLSPEEEDLNLSVYSDEDMKKIMDSLETMPFLADKRVVIIRDGESRADSDIDTLVSYLEKPEHFNVLIILADNPFKKTKKYKKLSSLMEVIKADKPDRATIKSWVRGFFKKNNIQIAEDAVDMITDLTGTDTAAVRAELDKLAAFSGGNGIEVEHVEQLVGRSVTETVFNIVDALNTGDAKKTFSIINDLYDQKKQPQEVIGYLAWYIRVMQKIVLFTKRGRSQGEIASELGYSPAYTRRLISQSRRYSVEKLDRWVTLLFETDRDIKTGRRPGRLALEMLLVEVLKKRKAHQKV